MAMAHKADQVRHMDYSLVAIRS